MRLSLLGLVAAVLTGLVIAPSASAAKAPCVVGQKSPKCIVQTAKIAVTDDGDTVQARIKKGSKLGPRESVRVTGIQAPELYNYSRKPGARKGACMGVEATKLLEKYVSGKWVRLVAQHANAKTVGESRVRLRRSIQVKRGGRWIDPAMEILKKGLALWFPNGQEWAWNGPYGVLAQQAAAKGVGLWNPIACGKSGPSQSSPLSLKAKWDGPDRDTANGEYIRVTNHDPENAVPLKGWAVRDSHLRGDKKQPGYKFPPNAVIPPLGSITVRFGHGSNSADTLYWGLGDTIFENPDGSKKNAGDGAYLFDPHLELRAYVQYPCRTNCADRLDGKINVKARYLGLEHEWVTITNTSPAPISLNQYELESVPWFYEFDARDVLMPGKSTVVWIDQPHPIPNGLLGRFKALVPPRLGVGEFATAVSFKSWNHKVALLADSKDAVTLRNPLGAPVAGGCHAWGSVRCPKF